MNKRFNKIYVEITNVCNLDCSFCSKNKLPKKEMTLNEFKMVIDKIKNYTNSIYLHIKGEPLMHSKLDDILTICDENHIDVRITTNGTLLYEKKDILLKHHIKQINISLHCENNYQNYFENIFKAVCELKKKTTIIYRIWTLHNLEIIDDNVINKIINYYFLDQTIIDKIKKDKNIKIQDNLYIDKDYEFTWPNINKIEDDKGTCLGTRSHIGILSNGIIVPCCLDANGIINLGNIFEESLEDVINNKLFQEINLGFQKGKIVCELCKSCTFRHRFDNKIDNKQ